MSKNNKFTDFYRYTNWNKQTRVELQYLTFMYTNNHQMLVILCILFVFMFAAVKLLSIDGNISLYWNYSALYMTQNKFYGRPGFAFLWFYFNLVNPPKKNRKSANLSTKY